MSQTDRLILASKSQSRRAMLDAAGVPHDAVPADVDERAIEAAWIGDEQDHVVAGLSAAKALAVAPQTDARFVLGSDSLVVVEGRRFDKPTSRENASEHLRFFSGKTLELFAGAALVIDEELRWDAWQVAKLDVRELSDEFIERYLDAEWPAISFCAGAFRIEGMGVQLFDSIEGDHFAILGMPLLKVLWALRQFKVIPK
ncbi:MAG: nucleoside triphosphate pyrophosphatase [Erythrobacter sp.]